MEETKIPLGPYDRNASTDNSYFRIDEHNMCITNRPDGGIGDSIGRTMRMYWLYDDQSLISGIENCWQYR